MIVGIDASNIRAGGGVTHLCELLLAFDNEELGIKKVVVWSNSSTQSKLVKKKWIEFRNPPQLNSNGLTRFLWQTFSLVKAARVEECDVLFCPGGTYLGKFRPFVTMSQNLLPFEYRELRRYWGTLRYPKFLILRLTQSITFKQANGIIFLTQYAQQRVTSVTGRLWGSKKIVPHGIGDQFGKEFRPTQDISNYSNASPLRLIYVSIIDSYKHQWNVAVAVSNLRRQGLPVVLDLVGPAYPPALTKYSKIVSKLDNTDQWLTHHGNVAYEDIATFYQNADIGIFASSCENLPIILLEKMKAGLPIACSNRGPMPEVLKENGVYFDPECIEEIQSALEQLIRDAGDRNHRAKANLAETQHYSWDRCAAETFSFIANVANEYKRG